MIGLGFSLAAAGLTVAMALAAIRLMRGPGAVDRIVALDLLAVLLVGALALISHASDQPVLLDVALVVCASAFAATVAMAYRIADDKRDQR